MNNILQYFSEPASCYKIGNCVCGAGSTITENSQPVNVLASLIFIFFALYIYKVFNGKKNQLISRYSLLFLIEGISAALLHWKMLLVFQIVDYAFVTLLLIYGEIYLKYRKQSDFILLGLTVLIILLEILFPELRMVIAGVPLVIYSYMNLVVRKNNKEFSPILMIFLVGFALWQIGDHFLGCNPDSIFQYHAVWHVFALVAGYFNIKYYLSLSKKSL